MGIVVRDLKKKDYNKAREYAIKGMNLKSLNPFFVIGIYLLSKK